MKLKEYLDLQRNYYGEDWCDKEIDVLIHISPYVEESKIEYYCERLNNLLIEELELVDNRTCNFYKFIETHLDTFNSVVEDEEDVEFYDIIWWVDTLNLLISGNSSDRFVEKIYKALKEKIKSQKVYRFMVYNLKDFNANNLENQETFFDLDVLFTLDEIKEKYGYLVHDSLMQTQSFLRGNVKTTFMNDYKSVYYYRTIIEVEHTKTKMLACIYNTETNEMY